MKAIITLNTLTTVAEADLENYLHNEQPLAFALLGDKSERYQFVQNILAKFCYLTLAKKEIGIVIGFLMKITVPTTLKNTGVVIVSIAIVLQATINIIFTFRKKYLP